MSLGNCFRKALTSAKVGVGIGLASGTALFGQEATPQQPEDGGHDAGVKNKLMEVFNHSEVSSTGWSLPLASLNSSGSTSLRAEVGYADATPGFYLRHVFESDRGQVDAGFMNFSQNVFPLGDTLSFNSKGDLYSNGEQTGDQLGLRYNNKLTLSPASSLEYAGFAGVSILNGAPSFGVNADYRHDMGQWHLLAGAGLSWLGERDVLTFNAIGAAQRDFIFDSFPDGRLTAGLLLKEEFGKGGISRATAFAEYQTHLVKDGGPGWMKRISALFSAYGGTESYGGKAGVLYSPGKIGKKDFGVSFGPSVGWDSKEGGPQYNFELRAGF